MTVHPVTLPCLQIMHACRLDAGQCEVWLVFMSDGNSAHMSNKLRLFLNVVSLQLMYNQTVCAVQLE